MEYTLMNGGIMKIKFSGEMTLAQLRQCIYEQMHRMEEQFAVRHSRDVTIYLTFTNGFGETVACRDGCGREITSIQAENPYCSAADHYQL